MRVAFDPQDPNASASASIDGTIKIWNVYSSAPKFTLGAHEKGLNFVDDFLRDDMLYLLSGLNDYTAKVWDDNGRSCVQTLQGHEHNVAAVRALPQLPTVITGSEDETLCIWDANGFGLKHVLKFGHGRIWDIAYQKGSERITPVPFMPAKNVSFPRYIHALTIISCCDGLGFSIAVIDIHVAVPCDKRIAVVEIVC
ncbi:coatomer subunit beta'-2 [Eucalyptus grandis]|uniref:coatomer subunit beta'-2 n=1 Tax=Eucalyptus grandis TaxID=71139 RepID=UPI00192EC95C|nr:coatomer subunit beta'-2 [Eucalyptus grandis]